MIRGSLRGLGVQHGGSLIGLGVSSKLWGVLHKGVLQGLRVSSKLWVGLAQGVPPVTQAIRWGFLWAKGERYLWHPGWRE